MGVVILPFLAERAVDTECRLSTKFDNVSSTDFSVGEHKSGGIGEASNIRVSTLNNQVVHS